MEFKPFEGNIYSFYSVGQDVSIDVEIEPIFDNI